MPEIVACPECGRKLKVPDEFLGKKVKCPQCSAMFKAEAEAGGGGGGREEREERLSDRIGKRMGQEEERRRRERDEDDDDRPSRRGRDDDDDRGRSRRGRDDDDDDRPRSRRGRDDDDDYDRPSRSRRGRDDYDDDDDYDRGSGGRNPSPKQEKAGWKAVSLGLLLVIISLWISIGAALISFIGNFIIGALLGSGGGNISTLATMSYGLMIVVLLLYVAHFVTNIGGHGFTLATPPRRGWSTKPLGISSFACLASGTLCFLFGYLWIFVTIGLMTASPFGPAAFGRGAGAGAAAPLIGLLFLLGAGLYVAGSIVFMFYLNNVCLRIKRNDLAKNVIVCFIVIVAGTVIATLISCLWAALLPSMIGGSRNPGEAIGSAYAMGYVGLVLFGIMGLVGLAIYIWYIVLLYQVRGAVDTYIRRVGK